MPCIAFPQTPLLDAHTAAADQFPVSNSGSHFTSHSISRTAREGGNFFLILVYYGTLSEMQSISKMTCPRYVSVSMCVC